MQEITGKYNTAVCYAENIEEKAFEQIKRMCDYPFVENAKIRIMPDVHAGAGCTIGTTMTIDDKVVPNIVGVDIGCGMFTVELGNVPIDFEKVDAAAHYIPSGAECWDVPREAFDLKRLRCFDKLKHPRRLERSLGTLGGGNHFIEIDEDAESNKYLVIHSGSRNLGKQVAEYYQKRAVDLHTGRTELPAKRNEIIRTYKEQGRHKEIQSAIDALEKTLSSRKPDMPEDLCYLYGTDMDDYIYDIKICQDFANRNREIMADVILKQTGMNKNNAFHTVHNYIDTGEMILRKGAIAAHAGQSLLIPINMRDGSILATGRGNAEWNYSAPHGAGRVMSRSQAFRNIDINEYKKCMEGIYTTSVNESTKDEAPMAYKSLGEIMQSVAETVDNIKILKPIYNFKAS